MRSPREDIIFFNIFSFVMLLLFFNIEILYISQEFWFSKVRTVVPRRAMSKSFRSQTWRNFDEILKFVRSVRCFQPFGIQIGIQPWIFCLQLMCLLYERCITGFILVRVLHSYTLFLSLNSVYHFVQLALLLSTVIFIGIFNYLQ